MCDHELYQRLTLLLLLTLYVQIVPEMDGVVVAETVFSKSFMLHIMKTIDYSALCETTKEVRDHQPAIRRCTEHAIALSKGANQTTCLHFGCS